MRSSIGLGFVLASFVAVGCAGATDENVDSTSSAMIGDKWNDPIWKYPPPPPPPVVFQSISGYAGYVGDFGHSDGPSRSTFMRPTYVSSNSVGTTWVVDEDPNDANLGYVRIISNTRGGVPGPHVQTPFSLRSLGVGVWLGGFVAAENGTDAYFTNRYNHAIYKCSLGQPGSTPLAGGFNTYWWEYPGGYVDGPAASARFLNPTGLARDAAGNIFVADTGNHAVRKIDPNGNVSTVAASYYASPSFDPTSLAVSPTGAIYAVSGHAVYRVLQNQITLFAGSPASAGFANGVGTAALFNQPKGLTVDRLGDVYVADSANHVIRKITVNTAAVSTIPQLPVFGGYPRGFYDTYGYDDQVLQTPTGVSFWGDQLVFSDADRPTVRTMNPAPPQ